MKNLPIGKQDFASLIKGDFLYVDKTEKIYRLLKSGSYIFLARPRRFGKSLMLSTIKEIFEGNRELFKGLWIEDKITWGRYPVIYIDFNKMDYRAQSLEQAISRQMDEQAARNGVTIDHGATAKQKFENLLESLGSNGRKAVVLIDEYDKAITDFLGDDGSNLRENVSTLKNIYGTLKSLDSCIHYVLITGVSKYGKVSIFSDLNNLYDATTDQSLAQVLGWTQHEVERYFDARIDDVAKHLKMTRAELLENIRIWYNGYSWDGETTLYNPFSILNFFQARRFANFWFKTGTPTFLTALLKKEQIPPYLLENFRADEFLLESADIEHVGLLSLLFQTGYLTIQKINIERTGGHSFNLAYPNWEVQHSFLQYILAEYVSQPVGLVSATLTQQMQQSLAGGDLNHFFQILSGVFASVPYQITGTQESYFHSIIHVCLTLTGFVVHSEIPTNQGRMDAVLDTGEHIYIFEFKLRESADDALAQIRAKGYDERYSAAGKSLTLVGVAFDPDKKGIREWKTA